MIILAVSQISIYSDSRQK